MVTAAQAQQQLATQEQAFATERTRLQSLSPRISQTRQQLARATPQSQAQVRQAEALREREKQAALRGLTTQRAEFDIEAGKVRGQIASQKAAEREVAEWEQARKLVLKGKGWTAQGVPSLQKKVQSLLKDINAGAPAETMKRFDVPRVVLRPSGTYAQYTQIEGRPEIKLSDMGLRQPSIPTVPIPSIAPISSDFKKYDPRHWTYKLPTASFLFGEQGEKAQALLRTRDVIKAKVGLNIPSPIPKKRELETYATGAGKGGFQEFRTKPISFAVKTALFFVAPMALKGTSKVAGAVGLTKTTTQVVPMVASLKAVPSAATLGKTALGVYGGTVAYRIGKAGTEGGVYAAGEKSGQIAVAELAPMALGTYGYYKATQPLYQTAAGKLTTKQTWIKKPALKSTKFQELQIPTIEKGKAGTLSYYKLKQTFTAGKYAVQPRYKSWVGIKPKVITRTPQPTTVAPSSFIKNKEAYLGVKTKGTRPTTTYLSKVQGGTKITSKREDWLYQQYIEKSTGRLIPRSMAKSQISGTPVRGWIEQTGVIKAKPLKLAKLSEAKQLAALKKGVLSKKVTLTEIAGQTKEVAAMPNFRLFRSEFVAKDISSTAPRAAGKTVFVKGKIIVTKPVRIVDTLIAPTAPQVPVFRRAPLQTQELVSRLPMGTVENVRFVPTTLVIPSAVVTPKLIPSYIPQLTITKTAAGLWAGSAGATGIALLPRTTVVPRAIELPKLEESPRLDLAPRLMDTTITRQVPRLAVKTVVIPKVSQIQKISFTPMALTEFTPIIPKPTTPLPKPRATPLQKLPTPKKPERLYTGFRTLVKRRGKYVTLAGVRARGQAIMLGERKAKTTLAATFKIEPTRTMVRRVGRAYEPSGISFRKFKIRGKKRIPLQDEWIQRRKFRLGTRGEIGEIQTAKRRKKKGGRIRIL